MQRRKRQPLQRRPNSSEQMRGQHGRHLEVKGRSQVLRRRLREGTTREGRAGMQSLQRKVVLRPVQRHWWSEHVDTHTRMSHTPTPAAPTPTQRLTTIFRPRQPPLPLSAVPWSVPHSRFAKAANDPVGGRAFEKKNGHHFGASQSAKVEIAF